MQNDIKLKPRLSICERAVAFELCMKQGLLADLLACAVSVNDDASAAEIV